MVRIFGLLLALAVPAASALAGQSLIPTPYPGAIGGGQPLNPTTPNVDGPERLMDDPYPAAAGRDSQGNPSILKPRGHQRLVPSSNQRKYRVDRD